MNEKSQGTLRKILLFDSVVEAGTGIFLIVDPAFVVRLLLGVDLSREGSVIGRCFGIAVLALGLACWPSGQRAASVSAAVRAMLVYNSLIALYLIYLAIVGHIGGLLLWPAVALHVVVAILLASTGRREARPA